MKRHILFLYFLFVCLYGIVANNKPNDSIDYSIPSKAFIKRGDIKQPVSLFDKQGLDSIFNDELLQRMQYGIMVYDLTSNTILLNKGEKMQMRPASVMKVLTSVTALENLGGAFQYRTSLYIKGNVKKHVLNGDIYIVGGYDPCFNAEDMMSFVEAIREKNIQKINGNIFIDVSLKDTLPKGSGWCWDDPDMETTPLLYRAENHFMEKFFQFMDEAEISYPAAYRKSLLDPDAELICRRSHSIDQILMRMLKESDNTYAESLFYQLGALSHLPYPHASASAQKIKDFIHSKLQLDTQYYKIADGSGLSLYNYLTPQLIVKVLQYAYHHTNILNHLYPALPIAGKDGTLKNRMKAGSAYLNVHAKTGTETGVTSLAGFCTSSNGHQLVFAIFNQGHLHSSEARNWQDRILQFITK